MVIQQFDRTSKEFESKTTTADVLQPAWIMDFEPEYLGSFSQLPPEIRAKIWSYFSPVDELATIPNQQGCDHDRSRNLSALMRTSSALRNELCSEIYGGSILRCKISPIYNHKQWLSLASSAGWQATLESVDHAVEQGFVHFPFDKLKAFHIEIEAAAAEDPGQILCLWRKCRTLVHFLTLRSRRGLPHIEIHLRDSKAASWCYDDRPEQSLTVGDDDYYRDYLIALMPFWTLRHARSSKVVLPDVFALHKVDTAIRFARSTANLVQAKTAFAPLPGDDDEDEWSDTSIQEELDDLFVMLENEMDVLQSPTANMLRLERFARWYRNETDFLCGKSEYEEELERIFRAGKLVYVDYHANRAQARFTAMRTHNPLALVWRYGPSWGWCRREHHDRADRFTNNALSHLRTKSVETAYKDGDIDDGWNSKSWLERYPESICRRQDAEPWLWRQVLKGWFRESELSLPLRCRQEIHNKLEKWALHPKKI
ncbi:hypothetical protein PMZ80_002080 [Knufia obscura]|uniref:2EXR domain-containing protein n=2 Tax=Knufia TaxID=430999 RepID=A0AAN8EQN7_9EURO|nr:hypothetical protein PMZ80_002080 [Knufia obscura]KAK5953895.1 hypothetical protein OHC33_005166 [Knufia fluminis]